MGRRGLSVRGALNFKICSYEVLEAQVREIRIMACLGCCSEGISLKEISGSRKRYD
jgi:hypothetical protein